MAEHVAGKSVFAVEDGTTKVWLIHVKLKPKKIPVFQTGFIQKGL